MHSHLAFANASTFTFNRVRPSPTCVAPVSTTVSPAKTRVAIRRWRATAADQDRPKNVQPPQPESIVDPPPPQQPSSESSSEPEIQFEQKVPGKIQLDELALAKQRTALEQYARELRQKRLEDEREAARLFGWVPYAETLNGRLAMFFLVTGLLTEYWTGYTLPEQVELMLRTLGVI